MPPKNDQIDNTDIYKILNKIYKLQDSQQDAEQEEISVLKQHLGQMSDILSKLATSSSTNINIAEGQKSIPYSKSNSVNTVQLTKPTNPDNYTEIINVYAENGSRYIQHMTIVNDGPGNIYFVVAHSKNDISAQEILLNVNDQRELFNVYEVRLRVTLPLTSYRLTEGVFRTGSFAPQTKANVEIRPTLQTNEKQKVFDAFFDVASPDITITQPTIQNLTANFIRPAFMTPLPPGKTAAFVDTETGSPMPFTIPAGSISENFAFYGNTSTDYTLRNYVEFPEFFPGQFTLFNTFPMSNRGSLFGNQILNLNVFSTQALDPFGAPPGGRRVLLTVTNDDPFNNLIGDIFFVTILRQLR